MLKEMRKYAFGAAAATALFVFPISAFSQSIEVGPGGVRLGPLNPSPKIMKFGN